MKRLSLLSMLVLVGCILLGTSAGFTQTPMDNSDPDINGKVWIQSSESDKRAFLLGVSNAVVLEYHVREKHGEVPSRFVKGWIAAFRDSRWTEMVSKVDAYYANNPEKLHRHVLDVVWHDVIIPSGKS
jgi:hypothetical protein